MFSKKLEKMMNIAKISRSSHVQVKHAKIEVDARVDRQAGFRLGGTLLSYQNYATDPVKPSDAAPVLFGGKYASGVTVNGEAWSNLNRPFGLNTTPKEHSAKSITFKGASCEFSYRKYGDAIAIFITNYDKNAFQDKPSPFEIVLYIADPAD